MTQTLRLTIRRKNTVDLRDTVK